MSDAAAAPQDLITELKVSAHLMRLDPGVYCVYHSEGSQLPDPATGLPGARLTLPPGHSSRGVVISGFHEDGWIAIDSASLIRVSQGPAHVLMTVYQMPGSGHEAPKMQVRRLIEGVVASSPADIPPQAVMTDPAAEPVDDRSTVTGGVVGAPAPEPEIAAHIQLRGDVLARIGDWIGDRGSQRWIEGFAVAPRGDVPIEDVEYQAVLGRGWLSPWAEGGQYCGSRGMALPILGLRARLRGPSAATHILEMSATFTDGTAVGPVVGGAPCEADSLAPLEAFQMVIRPIAEAQAVDAPASGAARTARKAAPKRPEPKPAPAVSRAPLRAASKASLARIPPLSPAGKKPAKAAAIPPVKPVPQTGAMAKGRQR